MLDAPFYLQLGDCVIEYGEGAGPYHVTGMSFPEPESDDEDGHRPATRTIDITVKAATAAELSSHIAALRRAGRRDKMLRFKPTLTGQLLECRVRKARIEEPEYDPLRRSVANPKAYLNCTIETEPYWLAPWTPEVTPIISQVPGHFDVTDVPGEVDALFRMRYSAADQGRLSAVGIKPDPDPDFSYLDDYGTAADVSDANAVGTYKVAHATSATLANSGAPPTLPTNPNRGRYLGIARFDHNATTPANVTVRAMTTTTGHLITASVSVPTDTISATTVANDLYGYELGDIAIPAGQVPDVTSGSGWTNEAVLLQQGTRTGTRTLTYDAATGVLEWQQTFLPIVSWISAFEYRIDTAPSFATTALLRILRGSTEIARFAAAPVTVGTHKLTLPSPILVTNETHAMNFRIDQGPLVQTVLSVGVAYANSAYAGGALTTPVGSGEQTGDDMVFKVYSRTPLGFNSQVAFQAACSEAGKTVWLDYLQRIPTDFACIVLRKTATSTLRVYYDGDTDTPYECDSDGIGPAIYDQCEIRKPLRLRPGVTNRVIMGACQRDELIGGATVDYSYRPRYLTATG